MRLPWIIIVSVALAGYGTFLPMEDEAGPGLARAELIPFYTPSTITLAPKVRAIVGPVEGHSCRNKPWDPPASEDAALRQMRLRAAARGANGIVDVRYERAGTDLGTNCWQSVTASGTAVVFETKP